MRADAVVNETRGRPKLTVLNALDMLNLEHEGTQYHKSVKMKESTWLILQDLKDNDSGMKSIDDVVVALIVIASMNKYKDS